MKLTMLLATMSLCIVMSATASAIYPGQNAFGFSGGDSSRDGLIRHGGDNFDFGCAASCEGGCDVVGDASKNYGLGYLSPSRARRCSGWSSPFWASKPCWSGSCLKRKPLYISPEEPIHTPYEALSFYYYARPYQSWQAPTYRQDVANERALRKNIGRIYDHHELTNTPIAGDVTVLEFADLQ